MHKAAAHAKHGLPLRHMADMDLTVVDQVLTLVDHAKKNKAI